MTCLRNIWYNGAGKDIPRSIAQEFIFTIQIPIYYPKHLNPSCFHMKRFYFLMTLRLFEDLCSLLTTRYYPLSGLYTCTKAKDFWVSRIWVIEKYSRLYMSILILGFQIDSCQVITNTTSLPDLGQFQFWLLLKNLFGGFWNSISCYMSAIYLWL